MRKERSKRVGGYWVVGFVITTILLFGLCDNVRAVVLPTGNDDLSVRWDNSFKYNFGVRVDSADDAILNNLNFDDGDRNFDKGTVTNRLDVLSELDFTFKRKYGFRVSGAFWYDQAYNDGFDNTSLSTSNHFSGGNQSLGLSDVTKRRFRGPDGELMDAFLFGKFDLGMVPVSIKAGRHTIYWGESLMTNEGISYSQAPIDAAKAAAVPGSELKELFRPLTQVSLQAQLPNNFSLSVQKYLQWEPYRISESGSYLAPLDMQLNGADSLGLAPGFFIPHGDDLEPDGMGDWGIATHWNPERFDGTVGIYYRRFSDMVPSQLYIDARSGIPSQYFWAYGDGIDLVGVSLSKQLFGLSVGAELSYRHNMPLASSAVMILPGQQFPDVGELYGARGQTMHGVLNAIGLLNKSPVWDTASYVVEFGWNNYLSVDHGAEYFLGRSDYTGIDKVDRDAVGVAVTFAPKWFQVFPGMDLSAPLAVTSGLWGNSAVSGGYTEHAGSYSAGLSMDIYSKYIVSLAWNDYFGDTKNDATGAVSEFNGVNALMKDRGWISLTVKATF